MMFRKITDINTEKLMNITIMIQHDYDTEDWSINKIREYPEYKNKYIFTSHWNVYNALLSKQIIKTALL